MLVSMNVLLYFMLLHKYVIISVLYTKGCIAVPRLVDDKLNLAPTFVG